MDPSHVEPDQLQPLIFRACTAWETQTGRKLGDEASVLEFLRALKTSDLLLNPDRAMTRPVREALAGLDLSAGASLPGILSGLGIPEEAQQRFLSALTNSSQREAQIKNAFAADSPADTAKALEAITTREYPLSIYEQFVKCLLNITGKNQRFRPLRDPVEVPPSNGLTSHGNTVCTFVILITIVLAILAFIALGPVLRSTFATYKGITPDPGGDYA